MIRSEKAYANHQSRTVYLFGKGGARGVPTKKTRRGGKKGKRKATQDE